MNNTIITRITILIFTCLLSCIGTYAQTCSHDIVYENGVWTGGSGPANAPDNSTTDLAKGVYIKDNVTLSATTNCKCLEIDSNQTLSVSSTFSLTVADNIILNGDIRMLGNSQLIQTHTGTSQVTGLGRLYIDQQPNGTTAYTYSYMSTPVSDIGQSTYTMLNILKDGSTPLNSTNTPGDITYVTSKEGSKTSPITLSNQWYHTRVENNKWKKIYTTHPASPPAGFTLKGPAGGTQNYTFVGTPNDGDYSVSTEEDHYSLIGNPYPSAIDAVEFINDNITSIYGTLYLWEQHGDDGTHNTDGIIAGYGIRNLATSVPASTAVSGTGGLGDGEYKTPGQYIAVGQSFLVQGLDSKMITVNNSQRVVEPLGGTNFFFKTNKQTTEQFPTIKLGFEYKNEEDITIHRPIAVNFKKGNDFGFQNGYDSFVYDPQTTDIYFKFKESSKKYAIAGIQEFEENIEIPLGIEILSSGSFNFLIDDLVNFDSNQKIFLKDQKLNKIYLLSSEPTSVDIESGKHEERFYIVFKENSDLSIKKNKIANNSTVAFYDKSNSHITIKTTETSVSDISLYNAKGQKINHWNTNDNSGVLSFPIDKKPSGIYFLSIQTDKGVISKKIIF